MSYAYVRYAMRRTTGLLPYMWAAVVLRFTESEMVMGQVVLYSCFDVRFSAEYHVC